MSEEVRKSRYVLFVIVVLAFCFFFVGIIIGRVSGTRGIDDVTDRLRQNELNRESFLLEQEFLSSMAESDCEFANNRLSILHQERYDIARKISAPDSESLLGSQNYRYLKVKYHLMQIKTYLLSKRVSVFCPVSNPVVLFYYSDSEDSIAQGEVLDRFVHDFQATVFAVEFNYSTDLGFLESIYNVSSAPTLIINYETKLEGLQTIDVLSSFAS